MTENDVRACPHCGYEIKVAAKLCKHCRKEVPEFAPPAPPIAPAAESPAAAVVDKPKLLTCEACEGPVSAAAKACPRCGHPVRVCAACGNSLPQAVMVCPGCGHSLGTGVAEAAPVQPRVTEGDKPAPRKNLSLKILVAIAVAVIGTTIIIVICKAQYDPESSCLSPDDPSMIAFGKCADECPDGPSSCVGDCAKKTIAGHPGRGRALRMLLMCRSYDYEVQIGWAKSQDECVKKARIEAGWDKGE